MSATLDPSQVGAVEKMIVSGPYADLLGIRSEEIETTTEDSNEFRCPI